MGSIKVKSGAVSLVVIAHWFSEPRYLVAHRTVPPSEWFPIAGGIKKGESAIQAALRELKEETQLTPDRFYASPFCQTFYSTKNDSVNILPVFIVMLDKKAVVKLNDEHDGYKWATLNEAIALLPFAEQKRLFKDVAADFVAKKPLEHFRIKIESV